MFGRTVKTSAALLAVPLAATMLLTGCGGDPKPAASPPSTTTSSPTSDATPKPTKTAPPTSSASPKTDPKTPAAARAHTPAGAEAFTKYFFAQLNVAWSKPKAGLISSLSTPTCRTCLNLEKEAAKSAVKNERVIGESVVLTAVDTSDATNPARMVVMAIGYQPKSVVVDAKGKTVQTLQRQRVRNLVTLQWGAAGWRVVEIQNLT